jgi:hypothetical protein
MLSQSRAHRAPFFMVFRHFINGRDVVPIRHFGQPKPDLPYFETPPNILHTLGGK